MESNGTPTGRRQFLNWFLGTSAGAVCASIIYPVVRFVSPPHIPEATTNQAEAGPVNDPEFLEKGFKIIRFGSEPVVVVKISDKEFRAFEGTCSHLACIVEFQKDRQRIFCNCHSGVFDLNGRNVSGPPPKPLQAFNVNLVSTGAGKPETVIVSRA